MRTSVIGGVRLILKLEALSFHANEKCPAWLGISLTRYSFDPTNLPGLVVAVNCTLIVAE